MRENADPAAEVHEMEVDVEDERPWWDRPERDGDEEIRQSGEEEEEESVLEQIPDADCDVSVFEHNNFFTRHSLSNYHALLLPPHPSSACRVCIGTSRLIQRTVPTMSCVSRNKKQRRHRVCDANKLQCTLM